MEYIKTVFLALALIVILIKFIKYASFSLIYQKFFIASFLITLLILLVVVIKLHHFLRSEFSLPNTVTYVLIILVLILYSLKFYDLIKSSNLNFIVISFLSFSLAIIYDLFTDAKIFYFSMSDFIEEIFRIIGTVFWLLYFMFYKFRSENK